MLFRIDLFFTNSFCYRIENSRSFYYKILGHIGPLGKNLTFCLHLGSLKFYDFLSFLFRPTLSYSKPFSNSLNYASTANIEEVMKFYNLGNRSFETDFRFRHELPPLYTWRSGYCYLNKGDCNLNQSKDDPFVERVAKNNS